MAQVSGDGGPTKTAQVLFFLLWAWAVRFCLLLWCWETFFLLMAENGKKTHDAIRAAKALSTPLHGESQISAGCSSQIYNVGAHYPVCEIQEQGSITHHTSRRVEGGWHTCAANPIFVTSTRCDQYQVSRIYFPEKLLVPLIGCVDVETRVNYFF